MKSFKNFQTQRFSANSGPIINLETDMHSSISNYPSFNDHIHPPSRFSDDTECEGHHRRKRTAHQHSSHTPDNKMSREAFQINVWET